MGEKPCGAGMAVPDFFHSLAPACATWARAAAGKHKNLTGPGGPILQHYFFKARAWPWGGAPGRKIFALAVDSMALRWLCAHIRSTAALPPEPSGIYKLWGQECHYDRDVVVNKRGFSCRRRFERDSFPTRSNRKERCAARSHCDTHACPCDTKKLEGGITQRADCSANGILSVPRAKRERRERAGHGFSIPACIRVASIEASAFARINPFRAG
jgi:hypothetical protein